MVNCWKEAVAAELQLAVLHALEAASNPDGGAESGECRLNYQSSFNQCVNLWVTGSWTESGPEVKRLT